MKKLVNYVIVMVVTFVAVSCRGVSDDAVIMTISADKTTIVADGDDAVAFTVMSNGADVTSSASVVCVSTGKTLDSKTFCTSEAGVYVFYASLDGIVSDRITITAEAQQTESIFKRHICAMEFTGAWCTFCPDGYSFMNMTITTSKKYKDCVHVMALHSDSGGEDALATEVTDAVHDAFGNGTLAFPSYVVDLRDCGSLTEGRGSFREALDKSLEQYTACCGVAVSTSGNQDAVTATVKVFSENTSVWRVALFIVEDGVRYYQNDGTLHHEDYNHRHVVRGIATSSFRGELLTSDGIIASGSEASKSYRIVPQKEWNLDKTEIYALAIDEDGYVNNMSKCPILNGDTPYDYK